MRYLLSVLIFVLATSQTAAAIYGKCRFNTEALSFAGSPTEQASCLLRKVKILGHVDATPSQLPHHLRGFIGQPVVISTTKLRQVISGLGLSEAELGGSLSAPLSRGDTNNPDAPAARYFVIHDTSYPNFGREQFPADIDTSNKVNQLGGYKSVTNAKAHIFLNRRGEIYVGHDFGVPWRATKLELKIGTLARGMFLHVENIQPRRQHPHQADGNAPVPGFTKSQYDRLALLYLAASVRARNGLIPAFHAAIDEGLSDGHDDPQNFSLEDFDTALGRVVNSLR